MSRHTSAGKEVREVTRRLRRQGWTVTHTGSGHLEFTNPAGDRYVSSATPGGGRSRANLFAALRRRGAVL